MDALTWIAHLLGAVATPVGTGWLLAAALWVWGGLRRGGPAVGRFRRLATWVVAGGAAGYFAGWLLSGRDGSMLGYGLLVIGQCVGVALWARRPRGTAGGAG